MEIAQSRRWHHIRCLWSISVSQEVSKCSLLFIGKQCVFFLLLELTKIYLFIRIYYLFIRLTQKYTFFFIFQDSLLYLWKTTFWLHLPNSFSFSDACWHLRSTSVSYVSVFYSCRFILLFSTRSTSMCRSVNFNIKYIDRLDTKYQFIYCGNCVTH